MALPCSIEIPLALDGTPFRDELLDQDKVLARSNKGPHLAKRGVCRGRRLAAVGSPMQGVICRPRGDEAFFRGITDDPVEIQYEETHA